MPDNKPGAVTGADLAAITTSAQAWIAADDGGAHGPTTAGDPLDDDHDGGDDVAGPGSGRDRDRRPRRGRSIETRTWKRQLHKC